MKKVAILSNYIDTFTLSDSKILAYQELTYMFRKHGIDLKRVSFHTFDKETWMFRDYVDMNESGKFQIFNELYKPDVIWNRSWDGQLYFYNLMEKAGIPVFPSSKVVAIDSDKYEMYLFLWKYQATSALLADFLEHETVQNKLSDKIVIKPIRAFWWRGIEFYTQKELLGNRNKYLGLESLYIVQDFKDFSKGAPWIAEGIHDVRLTYIGWKFSHASVRMPAKWSLKSNLHSGWSEKFLEKNEVPEVLFSLAENIINDMELDENNILSIDFWYVLDENMWYLFEINFSPGIYFWSSNPAKSRVFYDAYFIDMINFFNSKYFS